MRTHRSLDSGFTADCEGLSKEEWHSALAEFDDANFYQTWSYGQVRWGLSSLSHLVLRRDGLIAALMLGRIVRFGIIPGGIVHIRWGPVWIRKNQRPDEMVLRNMLRAMRNEYSVNRGMVLNVLPKEVNRRDIVLREMFINEGYIYRPSTEQTLVVDLANSLDDIRDNLHRSWNKSLRKAVNHNLTIIESNGKELLDWVIRIVRELEKRKGYATFVDVEEMLKINEDLPDYLKLKIYLCQHEKTPVACLGWWKTGRIGLPLVGGTSDKALPINASNMLWWKMIEDYSQNSFWYCDLAGTNPKTNPGVHHFKAGLAGRDSSATTYIGQFTAWENSLSHWGYLMANWIRISYKAFKAFAYRCNT